MLYARTETGAYHIVDEGIKIDGELHTVSTVCGTAFKMPARRPFSWYLQIIDQEVKRPVCEYCTHPIGGDTAGHAGEVNEV